MHTICGEDVNKNATVCRYLFTAKLLYMFWVSQHPSSFTDAKQAKDIYLYKNIKRKLYKTNAAIRYNKTCLQRQLTPAYVNIRINGKNHQCQKTQRTANQYCINQEIKFIYTKKMKVNEQLFKLHLKYADNWQRIWPIIIQCIDYTLTKEMETRYNNVNCKQDKLQREKETNRKTDTHHQRRQFYTTTVNLTNIRFFQEEFALLNNGLQYSIKNPLRKYWTDLIMETEQAVRMLDSKMQAPFRILATKKLKQMSASDNHYNETAKRKIYILKNINSKVVKENAMVVKADKGKTCVIIYTDEYNKKVHNFLTENNFQKQQKILQTNTKNLSPRLYNIFTLSSIKTKEVPHPEETPTHQPKSPDQTTQTRPTR